jgi:hypothetical protein
MHIWAEDTVSRGSQDIASCLLTYLNSNKTEIENRKVLKAWSDSCRGQNKNRNIIAFWHHIVHDLCLFDEVEHKFPVPGRTCLDCDRDFGITEKRSPHLQYTPRWMCSTH